MTSLLENFVKSYGTVDVLKASGGAYCVTSLGSASAYGSTLEKTMRKFTGRAVFNNREFLALGNEWLDEAVPRSRRIILTQARAKNKDAYVVVLADFLHNSNGFSNPKMVQWCMFELYDALHEARAYIAENVGVL